MTTIAPSWQVIVASGSEIGERPVWDPYTQSLLWVDVLAGAIHRSRPYESGDHEEADAWENAAMAVGGVVGAAAVRRGGGIVSGVDSSIRFLDADGRDEHDPITLPLPTGHRLNDGACDPNGRFLIGTAGSTPTGVLWSVDSGGDVRVVLGDITESNGLGWSDDATVLYFIDSAECVIRKYAYDPGTGRVGGRLADLVDLTSRPGVPDGLVIDAAGLIWVPQWQGGEIACFDPSGATVARWRLPVSQPTCAGFAGRALDTFVLATSWEGMSPDQRSAQPWAGHLLAADAPIRGRPSHEYAGPY